MAGAWGMQVRGPAQEGGVGTQLRSLPCTWKAGKSLIHAFIHSFPGVRTSWRKYGIARTCWGPNPNSTALPKLCGLGLKFLTCLG